MELGYYEKRIEMLEDDELNPLATFNLKGLRNERPVWFPKDLAIRNNFLYQIKPYKNREPAQLHRYRIEFKK